jgi:hypothetical protein
MRPDMMYKLVEPGRHPGRRRPRTLPRDPDRLNALPTKAGMRHPDWVSDRKELSDKLAPLERFLAKNVGRPWPNVSAEMAEVLDFRSVLGFHLKTHLYQMVDIHCALGPDGRTVFHSPQVAYAVYARFFVHPRHQLLCRSRAYVDRRRRAVVPDPYAQDRIVLSADRQYQRVDGLWYEVTVAPWSPPPLLPPNPRPRAAP